MGAPMRPEEDSSESPKSKVRRVESCSASDLLASSLTGGLEEIQNLLEINSRLRDQAACLPGVLGILSRHCGCCESEQTVHARAFVEFGQLFCDRCWLRWERCGRWQSTMRIRTVPPCVGPSGFPEFGPEDAFSIPEFMCKHDDLSLMKRLQAELPQGKDLPSECHTLFSGADLDFGSSWWTHVDDAAERWGPRHVGMQFEGPDVY